MVLEIQAEHKTELTKLFISLQTLETKGFERWTVVSFQEELKLSRGVVMVQDGEVHAFILARDLPEAFEITLLGTDPAVQRRGLMRSLFSAFVRLISGPKKVWLEVHQENLPALRLYESLGFRKDRVRPRYYADGGSAVLLSWIPKSLPTH